MRWTRAHLEHAVSVLQRHDTVTAALAELGLSENSLRNALARHGMPPPREYLRGADGFLSAPEFTPPPAAQRFPALDPLPEIDVDVSEFDSVTEPGPPPMSPRGLTRILVCSDAHHPYADPIAWGTFLAAAEVLRPDVLVVIGDFADCYAVSSHAKDPARQQSFREEIGAVSRELRRLESLRIPRMVYVEGNHEFRLARYVAAQAREFHGIVDIRGLLGIDAHGWEWVPYRDSLKIGKVIFTHDVDRCGIYAARQSLMDAGDNIVFGHSHRGCVWYQGEHVALNVGHLVDLSAIDYKHKLRARRDWQTGFGWVVQDSVGAAWCQFVPVLDGRCIVEGQLISGRRQAA